jgi:hypothetical protein
MVGIIASKRGREGEREGEREREKVRVDSVGGTDHPTASFHRDDDDLYLPR